MASVGRMAKAPDVASRTDRRVNESDYVLTEPLFEVMTAV